MHTWFSTSRRWLAGAAVAAIVAGTAPALFAQDAMPGPRGWRHFGRMGGPGAPMGRFGFGMRQLDLTDPQREQIRTITQSHRSEFQAIAERTRAARRKLHDAVTAEAVSEPAIRAASAEVAEAQADAAVLRAKVHQEVFAILTPEQQEKAKKLRAEAEQRMEERRQRIEERVRQRRPGQVR